MATISGVFTFTRGSSCPANATQLCTLGVTYSTTLQAGSSSALSSGAITVTDTVTGYTATVGLTGIVLGSQAALLKSNSNAARSH